MMSTSGYTSSDKGFFETDKHCKLFEMGYDTLPEFPEGLNVTILLMYKIIGHKTREIYFHRWTIMSVDESLKRYKNYCQEGQKDVFDIAYRYMGMDILKSCLVIYLHIDCILDLMGVPMDMIEKSITVL